MPLDAITIKHLTKDFPVGLRGWRLRAVEDLSFSVPDNSVFGLLGPNGSGKSTTMKIVLGLLKPSAGECHVYGHPAGSLEARRSVGFLPEAPYFYRYLTGRELVRFYGRLCGIEKILIEHSVDNALKWVDMLAAADRRVGTYSKGMLQRIGLAQALVHEPRLLILDEPTAGVDPVGAIAIAEIIRRLKNEGKTVLLCSHLLAQVEGVCDTLAIMHKGKLCVQGRVDALLKQTDLQQLTVRGLQAADLQALRAWLAEHHSELLKVDHPQLGLDELFLKTVQ